MTNEAYVLYKVTAVCEEGVTRIMYHVGVTLNRLQHDYKTTYKRHRIVPIESVCRVNWLKKGEY